MKLVLDEPDADALRSFVGQQPRGASSALVRTELIRVVRPHGPEALDRARRTLAGLDLLRLDDELLDLAGTLPVPVRSLDAIHLATAQALGDELSSVVTYDERMVAGARALGLPVATPREVGKG